MIAIFSTLKDAQALADKIHKYLQKNCPDYLAVCWQVPVKHDKLAKWFVQIPHEYYKIYYQSKEKIGDVIAPELQKASALTDKPDASWYPDISTI
jgi:hypothetical protein